MSSVGNTFPATITVYDSLEETAFRLVLSCTFVVAVGGLMVPAPSSRGAIPLPLFTIPLTAG